MRFGSFLTLFAAVALAVAQEELPPIAQWLAAPTLEESIALAERDARATATPTLQALINGARQAGLDGRPPESRRAYELVAALADRGGELRFRALAKWGLANLETDPERALAMLREALPYFEERREPRAGFVLSAMAYQLVRAHRLAEAVSALERALPLIEAETGPGREAVRRDGIVTIYGTLGTIWMIQAQWDKAAADLERGLAAGGEATPLRANLLSNLADVRWQQGETAAARQLLGEALQAALAARNDIETMAAHRRLGQFALAENRPAAAEEHLRAALVPARRLNDAWRESILCELLAEARRRQGEAKEARELAQQALQLGRASGNRFSVWHADLVLARLARAENQPETAEKYLREAIAELEAVRTARAGERSEGWDFLEGRTDVWWELADLLVVRGDAAAALAVAESARAHVLRDLAAEAGAGDPVSAGAADGPAEGELRLEFLVGDESVLLFAWSREDAVVAHRLPLARSALQQRVEALRERLGKRSIQWREEAKALRTALLGPVETALARARRVVLSPDGPLWSVPFAALTAADGRTLGESHALLLTPGFQVRGGRPVPSAARGTRDSLLILAAPTLPPAAVRAGLAPLPAAEAPARRLAAAHGERAVLHLQAEARESTFRQAAPRADLLHFATHGVLNDRTPLHSHLVLAAAATGESDDGLLEAREVLQLRLQARVAVLGSCQSGRGRAHGGEGLVGLSWAFLAAGCESTVVSLWEVDAAATGELLEHFHAELRQGSDPAAALRAAAGEMRRRSEYRHPYFWASFVVVGW